MNKFDILILSVIAIWFIATVVFIIIKKKNGKCIGCCGDCNKCKGL